MIYVLGSRKKVFGMGKGELQRKIISFLRDNSSLMQEMGISSMADFREFLSSPEFSPADLYIAMRALYIGRKDCKIFRKWMEEEKLPI